MRKLSLIIPVYNEAAAIDGCLKNLKTLPGDVEVIFADGGSSDGTPGRIPEKYRLLNAPKGRARQMNAAARVASGDILWFSHCDSILPEGAAGEILRAAENGTRFGCFRIGFDRGGFLMACNARLSDRRARRFRIVFGDQGTFCSRALFEEVGGFPELPIMEDYEFSRRMKQRKIPLTVLSRRIITSARRYEGCPILFTMWRMFYLRCLYRMGHDIHDIARRYRDGR